MIDMRELSTLGLAVSFVLLFVFGWLRRYRAAGWCAGAMVLFFLIGQGAVYVDGPR